MTDKNPIATQPLFIDGVRAHNPGDEVPADNVKRHGWEDSVAGPNTKAAQAAVAEDKPKP